MSSSIALRRSPKPGSLDGDAVERAAQLVHHERGQSLALDVLGHYDYVLANLEDLLKGGKHVRDSGDFLVCDQNVRVVDGRFHPVLVGDEVRGDIAAVDLHPLYELLLVGEAPWTLRP